MMEVYLSGIIKVAVPHIRSYRVKVKGGKFLNQH